MCVADDKKYDIDYGVCLIECTEKELSEIPNKWFISYNTILGNEEEMNYLISKGLSKDDLDHADYFRFVICDDVC